MYLYIYLSLKLRTAQMLEGEGAKGSTKKRCFQFVIVSTALVLQVLIAYILLKLLRLSINIHHLKGLCHQFGIG